MIEKQKNYFQLIYRIIIVLITVGFLTIVWPFISGVLLMLVFAFLLTTVLLSFVDSLERKIKSRGLSVLAVTVAVLGAIGLFIGSFIAQLSAQAKDFASRVDHDTLTAEFKALAEKFTSAMPSFMREMQPSDSDFASTLSGFIKTVLENLTSLAGVVGNFFFMAAMVLIFTIILLAEYYRFKKTLVQFISNKYFEVGLRLIFNVEKAVSSYLRGQFLAAASVGVMSMIGLGILNFFGANLTLVIFIGIIAGLANLIPLVGPFVGMIPAILISFMNNIGNEAALAHKMFGVVPSPFFLVDIILMFIIVQQIEGNLVTPTLVGKSVGIHPMMVMIALLIGGTLLGPLGMLFAVPAAGVLKVIGHEISFVRKNAHLL
ncbi:MAG: AI-2E family transporter [Candidatus Marinimicrobia bacterium]|nr:AI-2E family transporter [Candidatus Neomarinimicrobiota bacterium]